MKGHLLEFNLISKKFFSHGKMNMKSNVIKTIQNIYKNFNIFKNTGKITFSNVDLSMML